MPVHEEQPAQKQHSEAEEKNAREVRAALRKMQDALRSDSERLQNSDLEEYRAVARSSAKAVLAFNMAFRDPCHDKADDRVTIQIQGAEKSVTRTAYRTYLENELDQDPYYHRMIDSLKTNEAVTQFIQKALTDDGKHLIRELSQYKETWQKEESVKNHYQPPEKKTSRDKNLDV